MFTCRSNTVLVGFYVHCADVAFAVTLKVGKQILSLYSEMNGNLVNCFTCLNRLKELIFLKAVILFEDPG